VIGNQIRYMLNTDYGFKTDATVTVNAGGWRDILSDTAAGIPIVGVVADFHEGSFKDPIRPVAIGHDPRSEHDLGIRLASAGKSVDNVKATLDRMRKIYEEFYPRGSFNTVFLDESISNLYYNEQQTASLVRVAMGLAIFISCMGLFGLSLFTDFLQLVLLALLIASPIAWILAHRWLQDFAYRVPVTGWVFILAGLSAIALALITVSYQSIRAAMASPVKSLKTE
jgi:putative ABC transport system permease protein